MQRQDAPHRLHRAPAEIISELAARASRVLEELGRFGEALRDVFVTTATLEALNGYASLRSRGSQVDRGLLNAIKQEHQALGYVVNSIDAVDKKNQRQ